MRRGIFDGYYQLHIVEDLTEEDDKINLKITYSELEYPDFIRYTDYKFLNKIPVFYKDEKHDGFYYIMRLSLKKIHKELDIDFAKMCLKEKKYGDLIKNVPDEGKRRFVTTQFYGKIQMKKVDEI